jgi:hypothetical protein
MKTMRGRPRIINRMRILGDDFIPMERHGEMGHLFSPRTLMSIDDYMLFEHVNVAWGERDLMTRENVVALVEQVAKKEIRNAKRRKKMIQTIVAYIDELHDMQLAVAPVQGHA